MGELARTTVSSAILFGATFGFNEVWLNFPHIVWMTSAYVISRVWVDRYLSLRMPVRDRTLGAETSDPAAKAGHLTVQDKSGVAKWRFVPWFISFGLFDSAMVVIKNLNVQGYEGAVHHVFWGLGAAGAALTIWKMRGKLSKFWTSAPPLSFCETAVLTVTPEILAKE